MSIELSANGFSYKPIESTRKQRIERLVTEIQSKKALKMSEIRNICDYTHVNSARTLAYDLAYSHPDMFCVIPNKNEKKFKTETEKLIL